MYMTSNPFANIDDAYTPMYTDSISAVCIRNSTPISAEINCCVFPVTDQDPFDDDVAKSKIKKVSVLISTHEWNRNNLLSSIIPEIGDSVIIDSDTYKIANVVMELHNYKLEGRSI